MLLLDFGIQRKIRGIVVISSRADDLDAFEAAFSEIGDLLWFGLIYVDHCEWNDEVRISLRGFFDQVIAFAGAAEKTYLIDVQTLAVIGKHVEHAIRGINGQLCAALSPRIMQMGIEHTRRPLLDV